MAVASVHKQTNSNHCYMTCMVLIVLRM